jgi:hypothetical protein
MNYILSRFIYSPYLLLTILLATTTYAQTTTVAGYVEDALTGERLIGASVVLGTGKNGLTTNNYGFFSFRATPNITHLTVSYVGYQSEHYSLINRATRSHSDSVLIIRLTPVNQQLKEITVKDSQNGKDSPDDPLTGRFIISLEMVRKAPALLGENDIIKTIQLLPGVQAGTEGTIGINVRGGSPDQNLILLDGVPVYNINHLFGFFSVINPDAVSHVDFFKGSVPARYGGRLSSVLDITMKEGNQQQWKSSYGISPIAGRLTIEGPLKPGISSLLVSGRGTWLSSLVALGTKIAGSDNSTNFGFYDLNLKWNYKLGAKDRLYASYYTGRDGLQNRFKQQDSDYRYRFRWGNQTASVRWNHLFGSRLFSNTTLYYTQFDYLIDERYQTAMVFRQTAQSGIRDMAFKADFDYTASARHAMRFGTSLVRHRFQPEVQQTRTTTGDTSIAPTPYAYRTELSTYLEDDFSLNDRIRFNIGLHQATQWLNGGGVYASLQPRFSGRYLLTAGSSLKVSYNRMTQFLHLLTNSSLGLPTDLWVPVTTDIAPETATQWSVAYSRTFQGGWSASVESYVKKMKNVLEYRENGSFLNSTTTPWYERVSVGTGKSLGMEGYLEKTTGRTRGWLSYTLSKTTRQFSDINQGREFPYKYDRRHSISLVLMHELRKNRTLSATFVYNTGTALTLPTSIYEGSRPTDYVVPSQADVRSERDFYSFFGGIGDMSERNNFRTPAYHRLDISYRTTKQKRHGTRSWIFATYNTYNRLNPFYLYYENQQLKKFSLFPIIPSITYQREF